MAWSYLDKKEYPDEHIIWRTKERKLSIEQDFYRHRAFIFKCILTGNPINGEAEWAERLREIGHIKPKIWKQFFWILKIMFKKDA